MKRYQIGEVVSVVMVVMMVAMLAVVWQGSGHMGMMGMGHGAGHDEKPAATEQQTKSESPLPTSPKESPEHQH